MTCAVIIVAAGRGTRAGRDVPKQWQPLAGRRVIDWTVDAFAAIPRIDRILVVLHPDDLDHFPPTGRIEVARGGATRAESVRNGLESLDRSGVTKVLIHDVARPCIKPPYIIDMLSHLDHHRAAALALPVNDALWSGRDGYVASPRNRDGFYRAQTPQGFDFNAILDAHRAFAGAPADDVEVARAAGIDVKILPGDDDNLKITTAQDFSRAEKILRGQMDIRIGSGYDVHRFGPGDSVVLCGVEIPHTHALQGHSDADVGMHALTDALYGGLALGDIGQHFPPSDPKWKGAASDVFLRHAVGLVHENGFRISNMDITLVCERPKIGPHADAMRQALARITSIDVSRVSVKATTSERLGFTGREEGIAAQAVVTLVGS